MSHHTSFVSPQVHPTSGPAPAATGQRPSARTPASQAEIAKRAYQKYEARGRADGFDLDDWLAASHELAGDSLGGLTLPSPGPSTRSS
jgi:hypothetical protein